MTGFVEGIDVPNVRAWTAGIPVEWEAVNQIRKMASLPILAGPVAIMPDVHLGKGATVGSVIPTRRAIIPASVGVDIGCGMAWMGLSLRASDLPDSLAKVRAQIERDLPVGFGMHREPVRVEGMDPRDAMKLKQAREDLLERFDRLRIRPLLKRLDERRVWRQSGSLGGGNHFCELVLDEQDGVGVMLHSGSRNVGKEIGECAIGLARDRARELGIGLEDRDLAWLEEGTPEFEMYVEAMLWAQDYASVNRAVMMAIVLKALRHALRREFTPTGKAVQCHHNYASREMLNGEAIWLTRKGAVSARAGELGLIPGSMGARSFVVRGKGNPASYCSCSHGAGRKMSRGEARRRFSVEDLRTQTDGVECRKDAGVVDEIPGAYKDIESVMAAQRDLVEVVHTLRQVLCVKG